MCKWPVMFCDFAGTREVLAECLDELFEVIRYPPEGAWDKRPRCLVVFPPPPRALFSESNLRGVPVIWVADDRHKDGAPSGWAARIACKISPPVGHIHVTHRVVTTVIEESLVAACSRLCLLGWSARSVVLEAALSRLVVVPPLASVQALARAAGCSVRHLHGLWASSTPNDTISLKELLSHVQVLRAIQHRLVHPRSSWGSVASEFNIVERTLRNSFLRVTGCTPSKVSLSEIPRILDHFVAQVEIATPRAL